VAGTGTGAKKYVVKLCAEERERLKAIIKSGKRSAQLIAKARILLKADTSDAGEGWTDGEIAAALDTSVNTVGRFRVKFDSLLVQNFCHAYPLFWIGRRQNFLAAFSGGFTIIHDRTSGLNAAGARSSLSVAGTLSSHLRCFKPTSDWKCTQAHKRLRYRNRRIANHADNQ
jgi:hypothetical protein